MSLLCKAFQVLERIEDISGRNETEEILAENKENTYLRKIILWACGERKYHNYVDGKYNESELESYAELDSARLEANFEKFGHLLDDLTNRKITGNAATATVEAFFNTCYHREYKWLSRVLNRDLRCGFTALTVTKIFGKYFWGVSEDLCAFPGIMKAQRWKDKWPKGQEELYVDPKIDGFRLIAVVSDDHVVFYSSGGKSEPYSTNLGHIAKQIVDIGFNNCMLDGEIVARNWNETAIIKRKKLRPGDAEKIKNEVTFHLFDYLDFSRVTDGVSQDSYKVRRAVLEAILGTPRARIVLSPRSLYNIELMPYQIVKTSEELQAVYKTYRDQGCEGAMVKVLSGLYHFGKRTTDWMKIKPVHDIEATIIGFEEGTGRNEGRLGALVVRDDKGEEYNCGQGFSDKARDWFWQHQNEALGMVVDMEAQDETNAGSVCAARNPVYIRLRVDRD